MIKPFAQALLVAVLVSACASSGPAVEVSSETRPKTDIDDYQTWNFMQPLGTDNADGHTDLSDRMMNSMMRQMQERGLRRTREEPALLVDFFVVTGAGMDVRGEGDGVTAFRSHWPRGYRAWPGYSEDAAAYATGALIVSFIDPSEGILVAEGSAQREPFSGPILPREMDEIMADIVGDVW